MRRRTDCPRDPREGNAARTLGRDGCVYGCGERACLFHSTFYFVGSSVCPDLAEEAPEEARGGEEVDSLAPVNTNVVGFDVVLTH